VSVSLPGGRFVKAFDIIRRATGDRTMGPRPSFRRLGARCIQFAATRGASRSRGTCAERGCRAQQNIAGDATQAQPVSGGRAPPAIGVPTALRPGSIFRNFWARIFGGAFHGWQACRAITRITPYGHPPSCAPTSKGLGKSLWLGPDLDYRRA